MLINRIRLENFKCFTDSKIEINQLTFLVGINSVGKSSVIQSFLMPMQSQHESDIELNGPLINLGEYNDILNIEASDDSIRITVEVDNKSCTWGFEQGYISDNRQEVNLPFLSGDNSWLKEAKLGFQYISAERWGPRDNVPVVRSHRPGWLGKNGEHLIDYLYSLANETSMKSLSTLHENDPRIHSDATSTTILSSIEAWLGEISPGVSFDIDVYREANIGWGLFSYGGDSNKYRAGNIGFGISYSLSIIAAIVGAKKGDILLIENPEAHIHPRGQSKLGQLIAFAAEAGIQLLVETHSEHIINGARIAVRKKILQHDKLFIYYFEKPLNTISPIIKQIKSDKRASLDQWPEGFFDQTIIDMETIIKG
ncbi:MULTISPECIES: AAA family ATPase [Enterobacterales]|uniref:AAA family ATPase n=1 Tax=Enterobacterales TaxID=91347 RepID=UPI0013238C47|nr:DUF3696 domain-containing protein [Klebsiella oxytoca]EGD2938801.1 DUF3696 domain-containing protein [Salmonella enterica]MXS13691.1 DUF3696 domain-containing protein [Klebsiella oxytoca]